MNWHSTPGNCVWLQEPQLWEISDLVLLCREKGWGPHHPTAQTGAAGHLGTDFYPTWWYEVWIPARLANRAGLSQTFKAKDGPALACSGFCTPRGSSALSLEVYSAKSSCGYLPEHCTPTCRERESDRREGGAQREREASAARRFHSSPFSGYLPQRFRTF